MAKYKKEAVTATFHFIERTSEADNFSDDIPFTEEEFKAFRERLKGVKPLDLSIDLIADKVRSRDLAPIENVQEIDDNTICGSFDASYWGHSFTNSEKGAISAGSINLRPFQFVIYRSKKGRIYIGSQYLGLYGSYSALQRTIFSLLKSKERLNSRSFRIDSATFKNVQPKEVRVSIAKKPKTIASVNQHTSQGTIAFKKISKDDGFEEEVNTRLLSKLGKSAAQVTDAISDMVSEGGLIDMSESEIEDCSVIALVNGKRKTIFLMQANDFATRFPLETPVGANGHPHAKKTREEMLRVLAEEILSRKEL